jgi:hypothetical protein
MGGIFSAANVMHSQTANTYQPLKYDRLLAVLFINQLK